jgi:hypothetical protein
VREKPLEDLLKQLDGGRRGEASRVPLGASWEEKGALRGSPPPRPVGTILSPVTVNSFPVALDPELQAAFLEGQPVYLEVAGGYFLGTLQDQRLSAPILEDNQMRDLLRVENQQGT